MAALNVNLVALCPLLDADAVREIIDTALTDAQINNFLNIGYYMALPLTGHLAACGGTSMQCEIIKVLAAHGLTLRERTVKSQSVASEWSITFMAKDGYGLQASQYGQEAIAMDCSGKLAKLSMKRATLEVVSYYDFEDDED